MEKKIQTLARITTILKDVIQNKDRIIARLQQPYSLDCTPMEAEYHKQFSELLMKAASDYGALTASVADFQWSQNFEEPPTVWGFVQIDASNFHEHNMGGYYNNSSTGGGGQNQMNYVSPNPDHLKNESSSFGSMDDSLEMQSNQGQWPFDQDEADDLQSVAFRYMQH